MLYEVITYLWQVAQSRGAPRALWQEMHHPIFNEPTLWIVITSYSIHYTKLYDRTDTETTDTTKRFVLHLPDSRTKKGTKK